MNIEIANRLVNLRKEKGFSQEQLAEKIGVSRQAVSKWERSEASPDTDNLIMLARLYEISLDELLRTTDEIPVSEPEPAPETEAADTAEAQAPQSEAEDASDDSVSADSGGISFTSKNGETVSVGKKGIFVNGEGYPLWEKFREAFYKYFPVMSVCLLLFLATTFTVQDGINMSWIFIVAIPLYFSLKNAIKLRDPNKFPFPVVAVSLFALTVFCFQPHEQIHRYAWVILLTIPLYYWLCGFIKRKLKERAEPKKPPEAKETGFRGFLKRRSAVIDVIIIALDIFLMWYLSVINAHYLKPSLGFIAVHSAAVTLQMIFHSVRDRDIRQFPFALILITALLLHLSTSDMITFHGCSLHWLLIAAPILTFAEDSLALRKRAAAKAEEAETTEEAPVSEAEESE